MEEQVDEIEAYVTSSKAARFLSWAALSVGPLSHFEVSGDTLRKALGKRGYKRHVARQKPPLSGKNQKARLAWAEEHIDWSLED